MSKMRLTPEHILNVYFSHYKEGGNLSVTFTNALDGYRYELTVTQDLLNEAFGQVRQVSVKPKDEAVEICPIVTVFDVWRDHVVGRRAIVMLRSLWVLQEKQNYKP